MKQNQNRTSMNFKILQLFIFLCIIFIAELTWAQPEQTDIRFEHLTPNNGLPFSTVNDMLQDSKGFIWFATSTGLFRYDGNSFKAFQNKPFDTTSIADNWIYRLHELSDGCIMLGFYTEGLSIYNPENESFSNYKPKNGNFNSLANVNIRAIYEDRRKRIWIGTEKSGLLMFDKNTGIATKYNQNKPSILTNNITAICEDKKHRFWVCDLHGITQVLPETNDAIRYNADTSNFWMNVSGWDKRLYVDSKGEIWITTHQSGVYKFNPENKTFVHFLNNPKDAGSLSNNNAVCITEDSKNQLWIGTDGGGINIFDRKLNQFKRVTANSDVSGSLMNNSVYSVFKDRNGMIWIATYRSGLNTYNPYKTKFKSYVYEKENKNSLSGKQILCLYQDSQDRIWVGTDGNGLNLYNQAKGTFKRYTAKNQYPDSLHSNIIKTICEVEPNTLWLGTYQGGLEIFDTKTNKFSHIQENYFDPTKMSSNSIWSIRASKQGNLWLAMLGRPINYYDRETKLFRKYDQNQKGLQPNTTIVSYIDSKNRAWFASGAGLIEYDEGRDTFLIFNKTHGLGSNDVQAIFEDSKHRLWIGTNGGGLNLFDADNKTFTVFTVENGLPTNTISSILEDNSGNLWISTSKGISKFNPAQRIFNNYDKSDGLPDNEFIYDCALKSRNGFMYFGSINGLVEFHPDSIKENPFTLQVYLTDLFLFNERVTPNDKTGILTKSINYTDEIVLTYDQTVVTLALSAVSFSNQQKNLYAYKLVGFDKKWNYVGNKHEATYTNLAAGNYVFQVIVSNADGIWNENATTLKIKVLPPFWKRWYMYALYISLFVGILFYLRNEILVRERFKNQIRLEQLKAEKIEELNQEKLKFFTGISHEFRTPLTLIIDPIEKLLHQQEIPKTNLKNLLQMMHQNANRLLRLVNQLIDFRKVEEGKLHFYPTENELIHFVKSVVKSFSFATKERKIKFTLNIPDHALLLQFDKDKLDNMLFNLLSNAFRYTPDGGAISLSVEQVEYQSIQISPLKEEIPIGSYVLITVEDTGIGIKESKIQTLFERFNPTSENSFNIKGTGIGLSLVKEYVKLHKGFIYVESAENKGTKFSVLLPNNKTNETTKQSIENKTIEIVITNENIDNQNTTKELIVTETKLTNAPIVLIVEDNSELREYIKNELSNFFTIYVAVNGLEGYEKSIELVPDVIVSDVMMPVMTGIEMCRKIKFDEKTCHIPVVLLTAKSADESKVEGYSGGADVYLTKPFSIKVLTACIKNLLTQRKRLRERFKQSFVSDTNVAAPNELDEKFANKMNEIILKNLANFDFNSDMLASELAVSRTGLFRKIKALTGQSASIYIRNFRLKKAAQMLKEKQLQVSEIALLTGFQQLSYFTKCFKEQYGKSPREFVNSL